MSGFRISLLALLALSACTGGDGKSDSASGSDSAADSGTDSGSDTNPPVFELDGAWATACYNKTQVVLTYSYPSFTGTYTEFADDACTSAYHISEWAGTAEAGDTIASGARKLDLAFTAFTSVALTEENAAMNNSYAYCGFTDWEANVEKDVLGADCYGFSIPVGGKSLDIYKIEGDTLLFGVGAKIAVDLTEADRPTELDSNRVFTRTAG
jgi:hypothetical protein